jgi:CRP-like cAMP-binding protein
MSNLQLKIVKYNPNSYVIIQGDTNNRYFYIIQDGKVKITTSISNFTEEEDEILTKGDFFGVISCMSNYARVQTAFTLTPTTLIAIKKEDFPLLIQKSPMIPLKIIKKFSNNLRFFDNLIVKGNINTHEVITEEEILFKNGLYYLERDNYNFAYKIFLSYIRDYPQGKFVQQAKQKAVKVKPYVDPDVLNMKFKGLTAYAPANFMLFSEGERGERLYIIQKGKVNITKILDKCAYWVIIPFECLILTSFP